MSKLTDFLSNPFGKDIYRLNAKKAREDAHLRRPHAARQAAANFIASVPWQERKCVALYYPVGTELHTWPLVEELQSEGKTVCLPVVTGEAKPLTFRKYDPHAEMEKGAYGIMVPSETAERCLPDILVVPLLGFRRDGARLGMGGGYYDRTLKQLRRDRHILAVGYAYGEQEMDAFPVERHDQHLDWIVTEREAIRVR